MNKESRQLRLSPGAFLRGALLTSLLLVTVHVIGLYFRHRIGVNNAFGLFPLFDLNSEKNVPTLFSSILLIGAGALCGFVGWQIAEWRWHWWPVAGVMVAMGVDETFGLHQRLFYVLRGGVSSSTANLADRLNGITWGDLLPWFCLIGVILAAWYWSFARHVGLRLSIIAAASASVYLAGAVGFDALTQAERLDDLTPLYIASVITLEEATELVGACLLNYSVLRYAAEKVHFTIDLVP